MLLHVDPRGQVRCLYTEEINLSSLGSLCIERASYVEPVDGGWTADLAPVGGPVLGPFAKRSEAIAAEQAWLEGHWLAPLNLAVASR